MRPKVFLLSNTRTDWDTLLKVTSQAVGYSITRELDATKIGLDKQASLIAALGALREPSEKSSKILQNPGPLLEHSFQSFLVIGTPLLFTEIMEDTRLSVYTAGTKNHALRIGVISGPLSDWRSAIINGASIVSNYEPRAFLSDCLLIFEQEGLGQLWVGYQKKMLDDKTITLTEKKQ